MRRTAAGYFVPVKAAATVCHFSTEGPSWGYPVLVLGAVSSFLEPFCGKLLSKVDEPGGN